MQPVKDKEWLKGRNKFPTGFCNEYGKPGQHEGERPKDYRGAGLKTCPMWQTCPCMCHYLIDKMYETIGQPRVDEFPNPDYQPQTSHFVIPEAPIPFAEPVALTDTPVNGHRIDEGIVAPPQRVARPPSTPTTPTGRRHRGQLEFEVLSVCRRWVGGEYDWNHCLPKLVAEVIASEEAIPTPSTGAIQAVWDRWTKLGIAEQAKKPARFIGWVGDFDGSAEKLQRIKASKKRLERSAKSAAARGFR